MLLRKGHHDHHDQGVMIRHIAYGKAILAGVPFFSIVDTLAAVALPNGSPWASWSAGMLLHLLVGAIWAVFYAYFFWSVLPLRPVLQGLAFAFVPMPLAIFIMHPQLELMHPLVQAGQVPDSELFGLGGGWHEPLSIVLGHLIWGAVL